MIRIITALGNPNLNYNLRKHKEFDVIGNDIQYSEGIIELLEIDNEVDFIIISELLEGQMNLEKLLDTIIEINKNIKIILILNEENKEYENLINKKYIYDFFYDSTNINEIINILKTKNIEIINKELRAEIDNLKKIILQKNNKKIRRALEKNKENNLTKICAITGNNGSGKTSFLYFLSNILTEKILIIDFNSKENNFENVLRDNKKYTKENDNFLKQKIINIKNNLDISINFLELLENDFSINYLFDEIEKIKNNYDYIFIDVNLIENFTKKYAKNMQEKLFIFDYCQYVLFFTEVDEIGIEKARKMLEGIENNTKIKREKIHILFNKYSKINYMFYRKIIKKYFSNYKILGKISYLNFYNFYLKSPRFLKLNLLLKKSYTKIIKNIY